MKKKSARTERREREREAVKLARQRERLSALEQGGAPERPIEVESASQVEVHARDLPCARCGSPLRLDEHTAETLRGLRLRVAHMSCPACGARRAVYFALRALN